MTTYSNGDPFTLQELLNYYLVLAMSYGRFCILCTHTIQTGSLFAIFGKMEGGAHGGKLAHQMMDVAIRDGNG